MSRYRNRRNKPMASINVVPYIDVMLVLLIIFMVTAPLLVTGVEVQLPETGAKAITTPKEEPLTVTVQESGDIFIRKNKVALSALGDKLDAVAAGNKDTKIFVRGDKVVPYGLMMQVMTSISNAGYSKVGLITEPEE